MRSLVLAMSCLFSVFATVAIAADPVSTVGADLGAAERIARTAEHKLLQSLHKKIRIELTDAPLEEVLAAIAKEATIEVWMDKLRMQEEGITSDQQVTLNLGETTVWQALHFMLRPMSLTWEAPDGVLVVTTQAAAEPRIVRVYDVSAIVKVLEPQLEGLVPPRFRRNEAIQGGGNLQMPAAAVERERGGPPFVLAQFAGPEPAVVVEEQLPNADRRIGRRVDNAKYRAEDALAEMLQTCSQGSWIDADGDGGTISTLRGSLIIRQTYQTHLEIQALLHAVENILVRGAKVKSLDVRRPAYPFDEDAVIHQRLGEPGMIDANDQTLESFFQSLAETCGIRCWLDKQAWGDEGIPTDFTVSVTRGGASRNVVLNHVLRQLGLVTIVHEGTLVVTTGSGAFDLQSIAVYNTADIATGSPDELVSAIQASTAGKWEHLDGEGGTNYRLGTGLVVIRHSQAVHGTITSVLNELRKNPAVKHEPSALKLEQRIYPVADATAVADLVKTLPQLIPNWDAKQGSIHRLGQSVLINQPPVVHARVSEFISVLNAAHASLQPPKLGPMPPIAPKPVPGMGGGGMF